MLRDDHAVQLTEPWRPRRRQNVITALTTLPQGWVSAHNISARQQSLRCGQIFVGLSGGLRCGWQLDRPLERWRTRGDKSAHNSTTKVSFCTIIIRFCHWMIAITWV